MQLLKERKYFKLYFFLTIFINTLQLKFFGIEWNPLYPLLFLWAFAIIIYDVVTKNLIFKKNHLLILTLYAGLLLFATYTNQEYATKMSYVVAGLQLIIFWLIFGQRKSTTLITIKDELRSIIPFTSLLCFVASLISLIMFFLNISYVRNGAYLGLVGTRLFGVYFNCNPAAFLASIMMLFAMLAWKNNYRFRLFYGINFIVQLLYIILSGCRSALLIVAMIAIAIVYYKIFKKHRLSTIKQLLLSVCICFTVLFSSSVVQKTLILIPQLQGAVVENTSRFQLDKVWRIFELIQTGKSSNMREIYNLANEVSSSRLDLAVCAYKVWQQAPLRGVGVLTFQSMGQELTDYDVIQQPQVTHTHNVFIESLVTAGVFGFLLFTIVFMQSFLRMWALFKKYSGTSSYFVVLCFTLVVIAEFLGGMFDYGVFYVYSLSASLAWCFLGYLYWLYDYPMLKLTSDSLNYDFMFYTLAKVDYARQDHDSFQQLTLKILDRHYDEQQKHYYIKLDFMLEFKERTSHFLYNGCFKILDSHVSATRLMKEEQAMALQIYEMVEHEIEELTHDANGQLNLPDANIDFVRVEVKKATT